MYMCVCVYVCVCAYIHTLHLETLSTGILPCKQHDTCADVTYRECTLVQVTTVEYFDKYRRNVYVTPKSYLSFLKSYQELYTQKHSGIKVLADKINNGLTKLLEAQDDVSKMKVCVCIYA